MVADHRISGKIGVAGRVASVRVSEGVMEPLVAGADDVLSRLVAMRCDVMDQTGKGQQQQLAISS